MADTAASIEELLRYVAPTDEFVSLERQGAGSNGSVPWVTEPTTDADVELFEREVGLSFRQIEMIITGSSGLIIAGIAADADETIRRIVEESPWAAQATTERVGDLTLVRFGDRRDLSRRSIIRPIGEPGAVAVGDGVLLWSADPDEVVVAGEGAGEREIVSALLGAAELGQWSRMTSHPAQSVEAVMDELCEVTCDEPVMARARASATRFGNPLRYERITLVRGADVRNVALVFRHEDEDTAMANAVRLADIIPATVGRSGDESLVGGLRVESVGRVAVDVVVRLTELRADVADGLLTSWSLRWGD